MPHDYDLEGTPEGVFGAELRYYRTEAGLSQAELAALVNVSHHVISKIETGDRAPARGFPQRLDAVAQLDTRAGLARLWRHLSKSARRHGYPGWFGDWAGMEASAIRIHWFEPLLIPGLLQTEDYARALLAGRIGCSTDKTDAVIAARIERQAILTRDKNPAEFFTVLDEMALRRPVGGRHVMAEQLRHLAEASRLPNIVMQVIPAHTGVHDGLAGAGFAIAEFADAPNAGYQETALRGQVIQDPRDVAALEVTWDRLRSEALPRAASAELVEEVAKSWTLTA